MPDIRDIKPPLDWPANYAWLIVLLVLALMMGIAFLWWWIKKKNSVPKNILPPKTVWEIACEELEKLRQEDLLSQGKFKEYYSRLSDIVRSYVEERFKLRAPEMTTEEFLLSLENAAVIQGPQKEILKEFLYFCDLVKFAKHIPLASEGVQAFAIVKRFVEETK